MARFADQIDLAEVLSELGDGEFVYTPVGGSARSIKGLFDETYQLLTYQEGSAVQTEKPVLMCKRSDVIGAGTRGDTVVVDGTTYYVTHIKPYGDQTILVLSEDNVNE